MTSKKVAVESTSFQKYLDLKSWKFYAAVIAGITVTGAIVLLNKQNRQPTAKRQQPPPSNELVPGLTDDMYEAMTDDAIALLSAQQRLSVSISLKAKGNKAFEEKKFHDAIHQYTQAIRFSADPIFYSNRAACFSNLGQMDQAIRDCTAALSVNPTYIKAFQRRAQAYEHMGDEANALFDYTAISILEGFKNEQAEEATNRLLKSISKQKAKEIIKALHLKLIDNQTKAHRLPSSVVITAYLNSFRPDENAGNLPYALSEHDGDAYYLKARAALAQKKYYEALEYVQMAIELECSKQALALNLKGTLTYLQGKSDVAIEAFNQALILDPEYIQIYIKKSNVYMEQGDLASALRQLELATKIDPLDPDIYYHRGQVFNVSAQYDLALNDYTESIHLDPSFMYAQIQLAVVNHRLGYHATSALMFQKITEQFPLSVEVFNYYGEVLVDQGQVQKAIDMFDKAISLDPSHPVPYINKAMLLYQNLGKPEEAIQLCKNALDADPACDAAVASLAQMLIEQDQPSEALIYYEKAIELARTQTELEHVISYVEATKSQIRFAREYPNAAAKLRTLK